MKAPQQNARPSLNERASNFFKVLASAGVPAADRAKALNGLKAGRLALTDGLIYQRFQIADATAIVIDTSICKLFNSGVGDGVSAVGFSGTSLQTHYHTNLSKGGLLANGEYFVPRYLGFELPHNIDPADVQELRHVKVRLRPQGGNQTVDLGKFDMFPPLHRYTFEVAPTVPTTNVTAITPPDASTAGFMHRTIGPAQHIGDRMVIRGTQFANEVDFVELFATHSFTITGVATTSPVEIEARMYGDYLQVITGK